MTINVGDVGEIIRDGGVTVGSNGTVASIGILERGRRSGGERPPVGGVACWMAFFSRLDLSGEAKDNHTGRAMQVVQPRPQR